MRRTLTMRSGWRRCSLRTTEARNRCTRVGGSAGALRCSRTGRLSSMGCRTSAQNWSLSSVDGEVEWGEWHWHGHHVDGSPFAMRGVTIFVVRDGLVAEGRLYMEPVEADGGDIEAAVQELYKPPPGSSH